MALHTYHTQSHLHVLYIYVGTCTCIYLFLYDVAFILGDVCKVVKIPRNDGQIVGVVVSLLSGLCHGSQQLMEVLTVERQLQREREREEAGGGGGGVGKKLIL